MDRDQLDAAHKAATRSHLRRLVDNYDTYLPVWLAELAAIAERHAQDMGVIAVKPADDIPGDAAIEAWIERNPQAFEVWARKQARINGTGATGMTPAARRTTARRSAK